MVFSSVPLFLDPSNWHQEQLPSHHETPQHRSTDHGGGDDVHSQQPAEQPGCGGGGGSSSIRPGSMADRARLAKIPLPEAGLKCPRCESANTKFCYFNNYSLSQPRHFCKTCRRYWTRGGALRSVPVGGGCRRNKRRSKGGNNNNNSNNRSKSPINTAPSSSSNYIGLGSNSCTTHLATGHINIPPQITQNFPILSPLYSLVDYNSADIGLNYSGVQPPAAASGGEFQIGTTNPSGVGGSMLSNNGFMEQFKSMQLQGQQFPMFANLDPPAISSALFGFEQGVLSVDNNYVGQYRSKLPLMDTGITQRAAIDVKIEENSSRDVLDITRNNNNNNNNNNDNNNNNQIWDSNGNGNGDGSGNGWSSPDFLGFTSSTSSRLL